MVKVSLVTAVFLLGIANAYSAGEGYRKMPEKGHEWSEIEIAKGIVAMNASDRDSAMSHFEKALKLDPRNFVALEYEATLYERQGEYSKAIATLARAKHLAPAPRWGQLNFQMGRIYLASQNPERAEIYLKLAIEQGGQLTAANYTLGFLLYKQERFFEAERYLHDARNRAAKTTALASDRELLQAINYYLGEIYARLGFTQYSIVALRGTEVGESWELRQAAWRVHSELNHWSWYLNTGMFGQYDSNVVVVPVGGALPVEFSSQGGPSVVLSANAGAQTSPAKRWILGVETSLYLNTHFNQTLSAFDVLSLSMGVWGSYWSQSDWSLNVRYDLTDILSDRNDFSRFQSAMGPTASVNYFPFQRWNWEVGGQYRVNSFATDLSTGADRRSGTTYTAFFKASLKAPNPRLRPSFGYSFDLDETDGLNFQSRTHSLNAQADWRLFEKTHFSAGITFSKVYYPNHIQGRRDTIQQARFALSHILNAHWMALMDVTQLDDESTLTGFSYKRMVTTLGATYTF